MIVKLCSLAAKKLQSMTARRVCITAAIAAVMLILTAAPTTAAYQFTALSNETKIETTAEYGVSPYNAVVLARDQAKGATAPKVNIAEKPVQARSIQATQQSLPAFSSQTLLQASFNEPLTSFTLDTDDSDFCEDAIGDGVSGDDAYVNLTASTGVFIWPTTGHLTSLFGHRDTNVGSSNHKGIDICGGYGQPIFAADGGEVIESRWSDSYGYVVQVLHDGGDVTLYCHCKSLLVSVGERVRQGQEIALMGSTGIATGTHLHFEVIVDGVSVDPLPRLPQDMAEAGVWR